MDSLLVGEKGGLRASLEGLWTALPFPTGKLVKIHPPRSIDLTIKEFRYLKNCLIIKAFIVVPFPKK